MALGAPCAVAGADAGMLVSRDLGTSPLLLANPSSSVNTRRVDIRQARASPLRASSSDGLRLLQRKSKRPVLGNRANGTGVLPPLKAAASTLEPVSTTMFALVSCFARFAASAPSPLAWPSKHGLPDHRSVPHHRARTDLELLGRRTRRQREQHPGTSGRLGHQKHLGAPLGDLVGVTLLDGHSRRDTRQLGRGGTIRAFRRQVGTCDERYREDGYGSVDQRASVGLGDSSTAPADDAGCDTELGSTRYPLDDPTYTLPPQREDRLTSMKRLRIAWCDRRICASTEGAYSAR